MTDPSPKIGRREQEIFESSADGYEEAKRLGLHLGDEWVAPSVSAAAALFGNGPLMHWAAIMASVHPSALDFIRQAPVLVLIVSDGAPEMRPRQRHFCLVQWKTLCQEGRSLREILRLYAIPKPMRRLTGRALFRDARRTIAALSVSLTPSELAQAIPARGQTLWLNVCRQYVMNFDRRSGHKPVYAKVVPGLDWLACNWKNRPKGFLPVMAEDLGDFIQRNLPTIDRKWTFETMMAQEQRWHERLANMRASAEKVPTEPFTKMELMGFEFIPLDSPAALVAEGAAMHHCVGSYGEALVTGASRIISVRQKGMRVATAEFVIKDYDKVPIEPEGLGVADPTKSATSTYWLRPRWVLRQFRAACNRQPSINAAVAIEDYAERCEAAWSAPQ